MRGFEGQCQIVGGMEAIVGAFGEATLDDAHERRRQGRIEAGKGSGLAPQDRGHRLRGGLLLEGPTAPERLVEHHAASKDVRPRVGGQPTHLLRRHVCRGAEGGGSFGGQGFPRFGRGVFALAGGCGQAQVQDLDPAVRGDEEVLGLEVAMEDAARVQGREPVCDLIREAHGLARGERAGSEVHA